MAEPRLAKALVHLREQVNSAAPNRDKSSDGWIGDTSHQARRSDHNPDSEGYVYALDISNDPAHGVDSELLAEAIRTSKDPRLQYVISNKKIANMDIEGGKWRPYNGANPHNHHCHISVRHSATLRDDTRDWKIGELRRDLSAPNVAPSPLMKKGMPESALVSELKQKLIHQVEQEKGFGELTEALVKAYQSHHGLEADGVVGRYTMTKLREGEVT